jgi:hypothetical protein
MIIYGIRSKELTKETLTDKCTSCGSQHSIDMHVFQKYAHVFWIPIFPAGKTGVSQCDHCKQVLKLKEMPPSLKSSYESVKAQTKTPVWMFAGLAIFAALVVFGIITNQQKNALNAKLILAPQKGDVFEVKDEAKKYTLYKVDEVDGDTVFVRVSNFETNKLSGLRDIKKKGDSEYSEDVLALTKTELRQMLNKGDIMDIDRK